MREETAKAILKDVKKTYELIAEDFSRTRNKGWAEFEELASYLKTDDKLVDLGCGNGRFYSFLSEKFAASSKNGNLFKTISYLGIDNSKNLLKEAKKLISKSNKSSNNLQFKEGDLLKLPHKDKSFSVAACIAVLHHIPSEELREKAVKEIHRILKPCGRLLLTVWNLLPQEKYKKQIGKYEKQGMLIPWGNKKIPRYYYAFKEKELETLLSKYFKIIKKTVGKNLTYICEKL